jgi:hypothetical protein
VPQPAKPGTTLRGAEALRQYAWRPGTFNRAERGIWDWDPVTKSHPARTHGTCRHKAAWLQKQIGGTVIYGYRTDKPNPGLHCVLWINIGGHDFVLDEDGTWPAKGFPFRRVTYPIGST